MGKILGLDLGTNSVGWAIRDTDVDGFDNQIVKYGVLVFEKGVAGDGRLEVPKVQKRTSCRGTRNNYKSEKYRKYSLLEILIDEGMCPLTKDELNKWRYYSKSAPREYPSSDRFMQWIRFDFDGDGKPDFHLFDAGKDESYYLFRDKAIDPVYSSVFRENPMILGRIFYQLVQRRGFRGRDEEESKTIMEGSEQLSIRGRNVLDPYIQRYRTLGSALYHYQKENKTRIRQQYTLRTDYEYEIREIGRVNALSDDLINRICQAIISQLPLKTKKGLIGNCIFERGKKRASLSHPLYEEYRIWSFINNLKITSPEGIDKQKYLMEKIYPLFIKSKSDVKIKEIRKQLKKDKAFMLANFDDNTKIPSGRILYLFNKLFGDDWKTKLGWNMLNNRPSQPEKKREKGYDYQDIWHILYTSDDRDFLRDFAIKKLGLKDKDAEYFSKFTPVLGYASLSISAIKKILPYLMQGFIYSEAVFMANIHKVLGPEKWNKNTFDDIVSLMKKTLLDQENIRTVYSIVNRLIAKEINSEYQYVIEENRDLDSEEKRDVIDAIKYTIGINKWEQMSDQHKQYIESAVKEHYYSFLCTPFRERKNVFKKIPRFHDLLFKVIAERYDLADSAKRYIWHPSEQEIYKAADYYYKYLLEDKPHFIIERNRKIFEKKHPDAEYDGIVLKLLGKPEPLSNGFKNPMALKTLHQMRHLINYLLQTGQIDEETKVVIEIARELNDANKRKAYREWQLEREKIRNSYKKIIEEINSQCKTSYNPDDETLLLKIELWMEQGKQCLYTGKTISACDLFNGLKFDIEHTIPASISFDNEMKNLTLADSYYNREIKKNKIPTQLVNYSEDQQGYKAILPRIKWLETKKNEYENKVKEWRNKASFATKKDYKDFCIVQAHKNKFYRDYFKAKYDTFTIEEYKPSWRNSQLRDTQIITKYAKPYLETIFKNVSVEKAVVINEFKHIFDIFPNNEVKDRSHHAHHAQDAAILTLIPNTRKKEVLLEQYYLARESGHKFKSAPVGWAKFNAQMIKSIKDNILINHRSVDRTMLPSKKIIRKRGKICYHKSINGGIAPMISTGDTIRGQLHGETFYGAIKEPLRDEKGSVIFDSNGRMCLKDKIRIVLRRDLVYKKDQNSPGFKNLEELEKVIVDKDLFEMIKLQVEQSSFKDALNNGVYMLDKSGQKVNQIRRVRCFVANPSNYDNMVKVHQHTLASTKEYKRHLLAKNGENPICLYYRENNNRAIRVISINELAELGFVSDKQFFMEPEYQSIKKGKSQLPLVSVFHIGDKVLFYEKEKEELYDCVDNVGEISKRLFIIYQFEQDGRIRFKNHLMASFENIKPSSRFMINDNAMLLRLTSSAFNFLVENRDFIFNLDGTISWKN